MSLDGTTYRSRTQVLLALLLVVLLAAAMVTVIAQPADSWGSRYFDYKSCKGYGSTYAVSQNQAKSYTTEAAGWWYCVDRVSVKMSYCTGAGGCDQTSWRYGGRYASVYSPGNVSVTWAGGMHRIKVDASWSPIHFT